EQTPPRRPIFGYRTGLLCSTMPPPDAQITGLLIEARGGDRSAFDAAFAAIYERLEAVARRHLIGERRGQTLTTGALVHEAYEHLVDQDRVNYQDRRHFLNMAGMAMRRIIIDHARKRRALKRGGGQRPATLDDNLNVSASQAQHEDLLALDEALERLAGLNERLARVVELKYFAGFTDQEAGEALGISERTVRRDWEKARVLLYRQLKS
ncbi:MAG: sigma-70 family RNA polymerase sigma factor, partial [Bacteroidota bacterium]